MRSREKDYSSGCRRRTDGHAMEATSRAKLDVRGVSLDLLNERTGRSLRVLCNIDFAVFEGELVAIVGPSGCGKSTFLNAVDGLLPVTSGAILLDGRAIEGPGPTAPWCSSTTACFPGARDRKSVV